MKYSKLIRDKIPNIIKNDGEIPITHVASDEEYWEKLKKEKKEERGGFDNKIILDESTKSLE